MSELPEGLRFRPAVSLGDLDGPDGNVFVVMGRVRRALAVSDQAFAAAAFYSRAVHVPSYQGVLDLVRQYVDVVEWRDEP